MITVVRPPHGGSFPVTDQQPESAGLHRPLVFVPGVGGPRDMYHHQISEFGRDRRVVATNLNATIARGASPSESAARDVLAAMDALGIEQADVLGASFGTTAVTRLAALAPGRVARMVWVAPPVVRHGPWRRMFGPGWLVGGAMMKYAPPDYHGQVARFIHERGMYGPEPELGAHELELMAKRVSDVQVLPFVSRVLDLRDWDWRTLAIAHPVLVMQGGREHAVTPPDVIAAWQRLSGRDVVITPGHHMPYLSYPGEFNAALRAYLDHS